jgi:hypothetical protein
MTFRLAGAIAMLAVVVLPALDPNSLTVWGFPPLRLVQVVHRRVPCAAKRPSRVWRSGAREVPVHPPGQAVLMLQPLRFAEPLLPSAAPPDAFRAADSCRRGW